MVPKSGLPQVAGVEENTSLSPLAHKRPTWLGPLITSLVVGTMLTLANEGDLFFTGQLELSLAWIIPLNYVLSLALVLTSGRWMDWGGQTPSGSNASLTPSRR